MVQGLGWREYPEADVLGERWEMLTPVQEFPLIAGGVLADSLVLSKRNVALRENMHQVGTPVLGAGNAYVTMKSKSNYYETLLSELDVFTFCCFMKLGDTVADTAHTPIVLSNFVGSVDPGSMLYWLDGDTMRGQGSQVGSPGPNPTIRSAVLDIVNPTQWKAYAWIVNATNSRVFNLTDGTSATSSSFTLARQKGKLPLALGSSKQTTSLFEGLQPVNNWWIHAGDMDLTMRTKMRTFMAKIALRYGIAEGSTV